MQPDRIASLEELEAALSEPTPAAVEAMRALEGDLLILGVAGKMGPTLALLAQRASKAAGRPRRVIGAARFSDPAVEQRLQRAGLETVWADLLDRRQLAALPDAPNVLYMAGMKFGSTGQEALTWAMNCYLPGLVCERFAGSRLVAFSTGNVYGLVPVARGGSVETDAPNPTGDYAMSCLGRERILDHFSRARGIPMAILRLNYAVELRYGVLVDVALKVLAGQPVDVTMGWCNVIWQPEANAMALQAFAAAAAPARFLNVAGAEVLRIRDACEGFARRFGRPARFTGAEAPDALISNGALGWSLLGRPAVSADTMMDWIAAWVARGGATLGKPTHFEVRNGRF
jgi:nucleoside-diphosphate-sugar epimerase